MGLIHFSFIPQNLGYHTNVYIILPVDIAGNGAQKKSYCKIDPYKTLYLLHGGGGNALDWIRYTSIERYANENNLAVVMPEVGGSCFYTDMKHGYRYYSYLADELPMVLESMLPLSKKRQDRYIAGLSMGGYGAYKWAFDRPGFFAAAGNLSGFSLICDIFDPDKNGFASHETTSSRGCVEQNWGSLDKLKGSISDTQFMLDHAKESGEELPSLFAAIGTEDFSYQEGQKFMNYAKKCNIHIHYEEMPGKHEWKVWDCEIEHFIKFALYEENLE